MEKNIDNYYNKLLFNSSSYSVEVLEVAVDYSNSLYRNHGMKPMYILKNEIYEPNLM